MEIKKNISGNSWINAGSVIIVLLLFSIMAASNVTAPIYELYALKYHFGPFIITDIFAYGCRDLTEKEFHLGGSLGSEVMKALIAGEFISLNENSRIITVIKPIKDWIEA